MDTNNDGDARVISFPGQPLPDAAALTPSQREVIGGLAAQQQVQQRMLAIDAIAGRFRTVITDGMFCSMVAPRVTCEEAGAIADAADLLCGPGTSATWRECHAAGDDPDEGDIHVPGEQVPS